MANAGSGCPGVVLRVPHAGVVVVGLWGQDRGGGGSTVREPGVARGGMSGEDDTMS